MRRSQRLHHLISIDSIATACMRARSRTYCKHLFEVPGWDIAREFAQGRNILVVHRGIPMSSQLSARSMSYDILVGAHPTARSTSFEERQPLFIADSEGPQAHMRAELMRVRTRLGLHINDSCHTMPTITAEGR